MKLQSFVFAVGALSLSILPTIACGGASSSSSDDNAAEAPFADEVKTKTDAAIEAEITAAAVGTDFTSESDYPFTMVHASLSADTKTITEDLVRDKLAWYIDHDDAADKPLSSLVAMSRTFTDFQSDYAHCTDDQSPDPADCDKINAMSASLSRNLRGIKVYYFGKVGTQGHVDGIGVSVIIVGRTPKNNLVGVRTIAIWT